MSTPDRETGRPALSVVRSAGADGAPDPSSGEVPPLHAQGPGQPGDASDRTSVSAPGRPDRQGERPGLLLVNAPDPEQVGAYFALEAAELVIGRTGDADVRVDDAGISRRHVQLTRGPAGEYTARDLGTTNGTFLNGVGIRSSVLKEGDRLQLGTSTELLFGTRREAAEAEIRLRQAISAAGAGTWEWQPATAALQLHGGVARAVGSATDTTEPRAEDSWARVLPEDREPLRARLLAALQQGGTFQAEVRLVRRDGSVVWVAMTGEPFRDRDGRPVRLAGALLDVTERHQADAELRRQSLLFDSLADAVVVTGLDGAIIDWSHGAERLLGWGKAEALGRRPGALLLPGKERRLDEELVACARDGGRRAEVLTLRAKTGAEVRVEMVAVPLVSRQEAVIGCVAVFRDLSERQRLEARLRVAERLASLGTLAAGVAHEINNPLAFVASNLEFVARLVDGAAQALGPAHAEAAAALADSRRGAERIGAIVRELQAFSRERPGAPAPIDANAALEFALKMAGGQIGQRARLEVDLRPVPRVLGDEARIGQVFLNLLVNAAHAIEPGREGGGLVRVSSRFEPEARRVVVEVTDDGAGIPADVLPRIFEPFYTTKPFGEGTGLGLFVCQGIMRELGGELSVESEVGKGSTFRVVLPAGPEAGAGPDRPRVLVVDDEPLLGASLRRCLADRFEVVAVADPRQALERVRSGERFQFAVVDLQMPAMSGQEFLARLRTVAPELARSAAVVTGGSLDEAAGRFLGRDQPVILPKPLDLERLAAIITAALGRQGR